MKKIITFFAITFLLQTASFAQQKNWGIGLRLGDPLGLTVKKYLANRRALEFNFGSTFGYNYRNAFYRYDRFDDDFYDYDKHRIRSAVGLQGRYLFHKNISGVSGLEWYYGFGGQFRFFTVDYQYRYYRGLGKKNWDMRNDRVTTTDFGLDGIIGLEYTFKDAPISVFADLNLFMELLDDPFLPFLQGGVGGRYNF